MKSKESGHLDPIVCYKGEKKINGFESYALLDICDAFLEARKHIDLGERQKIIAAQCEIIIRSFAKLGLIALIDEATGYQYERERNELQKLIDIYVNEELRAWQKVFPDIYYQEIFRLRGWDFTVNGIKKRPGVVGTWTNKFIYQQLPPGVLEELKRKTPKTESGNYSARFFQSLTEDIGDPHLMSQLQSVITLLQISDTWEEFISKFNKLVSHRNEQLTLDLGDFEDIR
ncbi:P63C domain-containing protein [Anabaenopsis sp. FSS-46]|uniref:P63C domain-containing protein n=1 Tax=Anabaenopsis sp. FSS-46 TaxID=2971766 RepID=UPI002474C07E|nr:P63C domain-containing protein [Anabaenopsis sp. FSS-46]MDH6099989.1 P63C domain-containing protein [Anabaenopsis sp. FSS-46]